MIKKVIFLPFEENDAVLHFETFVVKNWNEARHRKSKLEYELVKYTDKNQVLTKIDMAEGQIYVAGHGTAGCPFLSYCASRSSTDEYAVVSAKTLAERLKESGLPLIFKGKIKIYSCLSAVGSPNSNIDDSLAHTFMLEMNRLEYKSCKIYGYRHFVSSTYVEDEVFDGDDFSYSAEHKFSYKNLDENGKCKSDGFQVRARHDREEYPKPLKSVAI